MSILEALNKEKIIAILRNVPEKKLDETAIALNRGGIKLIEVTMNSEGALQAINRWKSLFSNKMIIGAGTVLNLQMAKEAISAGADFLITPNLDEEVVSYSIDQGVVIWPGVMTPSEMVRAWEAGAEAVKLFPAGLLGIDYIKDVKGPLDSIPIIATGGVNLQNIKTFLEAGVLGVGLGSSLVDKKLIEENCFDDLTNLARKYVTAVNQESSRL
ncbi:bifunctional 4-hydroxy-2-oxoglutarate aldolase/2-dehydro-3-deoxy-phosphogluconate aldolase [Peribacillus aracenensis]|uniref:bifunctional 4-hydroxy-2-oxoglutarate aldolase/2-dehydro-3-deoxy-phosphogluconate aldolase n=1 Tax=Peribacillus aracenensis TaxID=2976708 RepID=UPI0021A50A1C|nr:bifunctional 4-hydroxy-2-oxoglutarate aldolase/2-dehydro-3-deoxy-phosphogluconate aldolase [Peribacillus sp. BBB004]